MPWCDHIDRPCVYVVVSESIGAGDNVWVVVARSGGEETLVGKIRWRGYSQRHDAIGFGVQLDPSCRDLAAKVFAL